ncbi:hypothetical protein B7495_18025 (plasmid) [Cryobacterium sp. LW097]|uniref:DUF3560 domain-containing protein n=1 Tax=unclassified Cryobacterium TaxID=2649013 RepID=UPI000B4C3135|nr:MULTISPECIES: DUF3560 domain-containing protein [unclassified Cryobacterium]ASD24190.1 hypothetical protein B7495_18025 [Cryobacterium sp. LW097]TFC56823.1 DUF3560 domain-containing protein [Cryobacterium sp. TMB1-7]TFC57912.1 DUF3560 domain-containing protein [Cryobacterium sp. TMB3-1-2]TFC70089.1 DUF3560 domain-containing protein [Cryobacterium sp. TMB3-15]TFC75459.1 DUF3560 domain-containing protein [Cryobacterium sp. TMB3-10]
MLTITHTHEAGTMIDGTSRGDGTAEVLKSTGWRWGRSISAWFVPQSRDRLPKLHTITRTKTALEAAGFEVTTEIDSSHRATADVEAGKIERQADRVDALAAKAERKTGAEDAAYDKARAALDRLPEGGEPIKVGHHSEGRHRNAIAKADTAMRKSVEASAEATVAQARADAATHTTDARYNPVTVANRIETLGAELRKLERRITAQCYGDTRGYIDATAEQIQARATRLAPHIDEKRDQIAYWEAVRAAQVASGTATGYDRSTVKKGDRVKIRGQWRDVVRANLKTVSVTTGYTWTDTAPYAEIQQLVRPE